MPTLIIIIILAILLLLTSCFYLVYDFARNRGINIGRQQVIKEELSRTKSKMGKPTKMVDDMLKQRINI